MFVSEMRFLSQMFFSANSKMHSELSSHFLSAEQNNEISVTTRGGKRSLPRQWGWREGCSGPTFSHFSGNDQSVPGRGESPADCCGFGSPHACGGNLQGGALDARAVYTFVPES